MTYRVYHPETAEPFDVPRHRFDDLVLNKGWTQTPPSQETASSDAPDEVEEPDEVIEVKPTLKRRKKVQAAEVEVREDLLFLDDE